MKIYTETYKSQSEVCDELAKMNVTVDNIVTKYVTNSKTGQTHQSMTFYLPDKYSSILFDIQHHKEYNGILFYEHTRNMVPALYIPSIHHSIELRQIFEQLFGYDYIHKIVNLIHCMDEDGNIPVFIFFHQTLPRTDSLKDFYLELYRNPYKIEVGHEIIHIQPFSHAPKHHREHLKLIR
jgi:hypothetical protein